MIKFVCDCSRLVFFSVTPVSSTNKTDHQDIAEILLKLALNTIIHLYCSNQRLIILESGKYIQMERHVCPQAVFSELALYKSNFKKHECSIKYLGKPIYLIKMIPFLAILDKGHGISC